MAALKTALAAAGVIAEQTTATPVLSPEATAERTRLQQEIADKEAELAAYHKAVDSGLNPALVQHNMDETRIRIAALREQVAAVEATVKASTALNDKIDAQSAEIQALKAEIAALKTTEQERSIIAAEEAKKAAEQDKTVMEEIGELLPVELFAFGDFYFAWRESGEDGFEIGQLNLDLSQDLGAHLTASVSVSFDGEAFGVGAFTIDGRIAGQDEGHLFHSDKIITSGLLFGQFDVPFGIDYLEYPSIERPLVTGPLVIEQTHDEWNDLGGQFYLDAGSINGVFFVTNGLDYETLIPGTELEDGTEETTIPHETKVAVGTRIGFKPLEPLELGASFAGFFAEDIGLDMILAGGDAALEGAGLTLKGEYIFHYLGVAGPLSTRNHGFYGTLRYDFKRVFALSRYSMFFPEKDKLDFHLEDDPLKQLSVGFGFRVLENASIRFEYSSDLESGGSMVFVQLVGGTAWQPTGLRR